VILLGDDLDAMQSLEQSVEGITQRQELYDERESRTIIDGCRSQLDDLRRREQSITRQLRKFARPRLEIATLGRITENSW